MNLEFENLLSKHGEVVLQAILENIERYEGVSIASVVSLEERWKYLNSTGRQQLAA